MQNQAGILANGTVIPCCLDGEGVIHLGNINEHSFSDIIEMDRAKMGFHEEWKWRNNVENMDIAIDRQMTRI